jgi:hypothetical protein
MAYIPILTPGDLSTHIYTEVLDEITHNDGGILATKSLNLAFAETMAYLSRFDLIALFGDATLDVSATITDEFLNNLIKDIAVWQIIKLGNPNINYEHARWCYEDTIEMLTRIQSGKMVPQSWPLYNTAVLTIPPGDAIQSSSNPKLCQHF